MIKRKKGYNLSDSWTFKCIFDSFQLKPNDTTKKKKHKSSHLETDSKRYKIESERYDSITA